MSIAKATAFDFAMTNPVKIDGLDIQQSATPATAGDDFLLKPFSTAAGSIATACLPRLAMANPVTATTGTPAPAPVGGGSPHAPCGTPPLSR
jgi:hypothetical protein